LRLIPMEVNVDFSHYVVMPGDAIDWEAPPMPGVDHRRLDRVDTENERVTLYPDVGILLEYVDTDDPDEYWVFSQ